MFREAMLPVILAVALIAPPVVLVRSAGADSAGTNPGITLKSVSVDLPDPGRTFDGPGADAINGNCLACHSAGMVLNQPTMPKAAWQAEVEKMIHAYHAPVDPKDVAAIVDYLARTKGAP